MKCLMTALMVFGLMSKIQAAPLEIDHHFKITQIIPTGGAPAGSCDVYNKLKNTTINTRIPAALYPASEFSVLFDAQTVSMVTDNGWGDPYYLFGSNLSLQGLLVREVFIEFNSHAYSQVTQLIMRANPQHMSAPAQNCRIIGEPI